VFDCYISISLATGKHFFSHAHAAMDTGAPSTGLVFAVDDPCVIVGRIRESYYLEDFASVEIAGDIYKDHNC